MIIKVSLQRELLKITCLFILIHIILHKFLESYLEEKKNTGNVVDAHNEMQNEAILPMISNLYKQTLLPFGLCLE